VTALRSVPVRYAAAGEMHSCVCSVSGASYTFGDSQYGQTGTFDVGTGWPSITNAVLVPTRVETLQGEEVIEVAVGDHHTILKCGSGAMLAFGKNAEGQLGLGVASSAATVVHFPTTVVWQSDEREAQTLHPTSESHHVDEPGADA
jgi:alpha-tubulin suppressor-like RCC1 family protein